MKRKIVFHLNRVLFYDGIFFYLYLIWDRVSFFVFYRWYYKLIFGYYGKNIRWGKHFYRLTIPKSIRISCPSKIFLYDNCQIDESCYLQSHHEGQGLFIRAGARINAFTQIQGYGKITIQENVLVAPFCHINSGNHGYSNENIPIMFQEYKQTPEIIIGSGSWLAHGCQILGPAQIGKNSVIAAGAIVKNYFPDFSIIVGIPGRNIKE